MLFALSGLLFITNSLEYIELRWNSTVYNISFIFSLYMFWAALLLLMILGTGGRLRNVLHFLIASFLLNPYFGTSLGLSVQETIYLLPSFWLMFIDTDVYLKLGFKNGITPFIKRVERIPRYNFFPILCFGINWGLMLLSAGIDKAKDPLWQQGIGFYLVACMPWIKLKFVNGLLDYKLFWQILNYTALVFEILFLPLFLFRKTRIFSALLTFVFFFLLIFPLRIDFIGEIGITYTLLLLAATGKPLPAMHQTTLPDEKLKAFVFTIIPASFVGLAFLSFLFTSFTFWYSPGNKGRISKRQSIAAKQEKPKNNIKSASGRKKNAGFSRYVRGVVGSTVFIRNWVLFNRTHLVGVYEYKIVFKDAAGNYTEPYPVYNEDMTGGDYSSGMVPRYLQVHMYMFSKMAHYRSYDSTYVPSGNTMNTCNELISFQSRRAGKDMKTAIVKVKAIKVPKQFEGNSRLYEQSKWETLLEKDLQTGNIKWYMPEKADWQCVAVGLPNYWPQNANQR